MKYNVLVLIALFFTFCTLFLKKQYFNKPLINSDYEFYISKSSSYDEVNEHIDSLCS